MPWWQTALMVSGGVAWAIITLATLLAYLGHLTMKRFEVGVEDLDEELPYDPSNYTWVYTEQGTKPPIRVPNDLAPRAAELMNRDSAEKFEEEIGQVIFTVPVSVIRAAMQIAREEPDIEVALLEWMSNHIRFREH